MAEEIDFENGRNSNFEGLVTLTFDPAIRHVVLHQSSTSSYIPNFIQIEETTDVRTYRWTDIFPLYIIRSTLGSRPKNKIILNTNTQVCTLVHNKYRSEWKHENIRQSFLLLVEQQCSWRRDKVTPGKPNQLGICMNLAWKPQPINTHQPSTAHQHTPAQPHQALPHPAHPSTYTTPVQPSIFKVI